MNSAGSAFHIVYPNLTKSRGYHGERDRRLPFRLAWLGLLAYLLVSDNLLVAVGIPYNAPGGSFLFKLHPGSYLIALGFVLLLLQDNPREHWPRLFASAVPPLLLGLVVLAVLLYTLSRFGASGNAFFIDTLLLPTLLATVLLQAPLAARRRVFRMLLVVLVVNALVGIGEALTEWRLTPYMISDQPITEEYFRATAFGGHPLKNNLRTATMMMACLILPRRLLLFLIPLMVIAILAFGGRAALVMSVLMLGGWGAYRLVMDIARRSIDIRLLLVAMVSVLTLGGGILALVVNSDLGQRIFQNLTWDSSAHARILVFGAFDYLRLDDWLWGMGPDRIKLVLERLASTTSMSGWENFWVLLVMEVGLAWFIPLSMALLWMIFSLVRQAPPPLKLAAVTFLVLASANNSLATKSQELAILVAVLIGAAAEAELQREARP